MAATAACLAWLPAITKRVSFVYMWSNKLYINRQIIMMMMMKMMEKWCKVFMNNVWISIFAVRM